MVKRLKVGLIYSYNKNWVAGTYYIINLIHAINSQNDSSKPELIILSYTHEEFESIKNTGYPYLIFHQLYTKDFLPSYNILERGLNKLSRIFSGRNVINKKHSKKRLNINLDILFPATNHIYFEKIKNHVFWIPDFQEYFLPQFFSKEEILSRKKHQEGLANKGSFIIFSSNDAFGHFKSFYPQSKAKLFVLPFSVTHPPYTAISIESLFIKYQIDKPYFFCPNQVWAHKNHITVLKSVKRIKDQGNKNILVLFSGKEYDNRNPHFFKELKNYISDNGIEENVKFLGFIDRADQLQLMNHSICIIQPSLFEGWSTVIEDAKAIGQYIIASDLPVHREQINKNVSFFDAKNVEQLSGHLNDFIKQAPNKIKIDYNQNITIFGKRFIEILNEIAF